MHQTTDTRARMIEFIRLHYSDVLGDKIKLLDEPDGLDKLADYVKRGIPLVGRADKAA